jgi:hypothetical protein
LNDNQIPSLDGIEAALADSQGKADNHLSGAKSLCKYLKA